ncbi:Uncharacterized protein TPAR_02805 [Tolypocladium paradoxum]|uniref:Uncharacterized protein n=1 Tax=Tolypocladium paradoxum TaxID=94208 RepID=A0A2S4L3G7_9HYPO|nr:Uncharacterized protein TPAR_02805 [Tolypocladium paradoxum]
MVPAQVSHSRPNTPSLRKRRVPSCSSRVSELDHRSPKKQNLSHPAFPPARFWDRLSVIPLTRNARRELSQRNANAARDTPHTSVQGTHGPQGVNRFLEQCSTACSKRVERFARHGGPDLPGLEGEGLGRHELEITTVEPRSKERFAVTEEFTVPVASNYQLVDNSLIKFG